MQDTVTSLYGYGFYPIEIPDDVALSRVDFAALSPTWRTARVGRVECRVTGETWRARHERVGFIVPSAVLPEAFAFDDYNLALDPTQCRLWAIDDRRLRSPRR